MLTVAWAREQWLCLWVCKLKLQEVWFVHHQHEGCIHPLAGALSSSRLRCVSSDEQHLLPALQTLRDVLPGLMDRSLLAAPLLQVGSFEEVMMRMTGSSGNELAAWSQVMFVAPNLLRQAVLKDESSSTGK